jgi:probable F420-dependent oxidoreductase
MTAKQFRFGVNLIGGTDKKAWQDGARQAEDLGYDVIMVPDHLGMPAPFPALVSAAEVTTRPRLGTFVSNVGFYRPAVLARDVAGTDQLTDGRLEIGLGAGYEQWEFEAAELPFPSAKERTDHLVHTVTELNRLLADPDYSPKPAQQPVPVMVAGSGNRVLRLAARQAQIVGLAGLSGQVRDGVADPLADRVDFVREAAGERFAELELNLLIQGIGVDTMPDLTMAGRRAPDFSQEQLLGLPNVLHGSAGEIAEKLHRLRETYGITYFAVLQPGMTDLAKVISLLR